MLRNKKILAVITARGNSKRLPGKNTKILHGKPLIQWSIEAAQQSKYIDEIVVSSDNENILNVGESLGIKTQFIRPPELALDTTTSEDTLLHTINWFKKNKNSVFDYVLMLQPTSPLRTAQDLDAALENIDTESNAISLVSVALFPKNPYWLKSIINGNLQPFISTTNKTPSSEVYLPNGAIYIIRPSIFLTSPMLYTDHTVPFIMPHNKSIDIDTLDDFDLAEYYIAKREQKGF